MRGDTLATDAGTGEHALAAGRAAVAAGDWVTAFARLSAADDAGQLAAADLEELARAARLAGHYEAGDAAWERAHRAYLDQGLPDRAARAAWWLAMALLQEGEHARGGAWLGRAAEVLDHHGLQTVERGYLLIPAALRSLGAGEPEEAADLCAQAERFAREHRDVDLLALARLGQGQAAAASGRLAEAVRFFDQAMLAVTGGEVSPVPAGIIYCAVIESCMDFCDVARAEEWTRALTAWCEAQPGLVPFQGQCLIRRAEIMQLRGAWNDAAAAANEAYDRFVAAGDPAAGAALYVRAELARLRGDVDEAEEAYRGAARYGHDPHPGLALLRLASGDVDRALAASQRVVGEDAGRWSRVRVLTAHVEIALAANEVAGARAAVEELRSLADQHPAPMLEAALHTADGAVHLAEGHAVVAERLLRRAFSTWLDIGAPLDAARVRVDLGTACRRMGDIDTAELEWEQARAVFEELGAATCTEALDAAVAGASPAPRPASAAGLTGRELEVLAEVATGKTNREIAEALVISEKTVSRHLENIFTKIDVASRAAATAYAYEHDLV